MSAMPGQCHSTLDDKSLNLSLCQTFLQILIGLAMKLVALLEGDHFKRMAFAMISKRTPLQ